METDRLREYVRLRREQKNREAEAAQVKDLADALEQELLEDFAENTIQSVTVDNTTVYLSRSLWAQVEPGVDRTEVLSALRDAGLGHFVSESFNTQTVSSYLRDLDREGEPLPDELHGLIRGVEKFQLKTRRS